MSEPRDPSQPSYFSEVEVDRARRLLRLGHSSSQRLVDEVIDRLDAEDGDAWLAATLASGLFPDATVRAMANGKAALTTLETIKKCAKELLRRSKEEHDANLRMTGTLLYFLAVAAALAGHQTLISSRPRTEVDPILRDLKSALPQPWCDLLVRAVAAP